MLARRLRGRSRPKVSATSTEETRKAADKAIVSAVANANAAKLQAPYIESLVLDLKTEVMKNHFGDLLETTMRKR